MEEVRRLSQLPPYGAACVSGIEDCGIKARLMSLGITEGAQLVRLFSAASGDPTAYSVRGTVVALRKRDAERILIGGGKWD